MNRRLRKKKHKGEYAVFGFHLEFNTKERLEFGDDFRGPGMVFSETLDAWAHERGWCVAPGGDGKRWGAYVTPDHDRENKPNSGITKEGMAEILAHVKELPEVDKMVAGPLCDAYQDNAVEWHEFCRLADETLGSR